MEESFLKNRNKRHILVAILLAVVFISLTIGVTVAFFNYTRTGSTNILAVGKINFNSSEGTSINLTNVFPVKSTELENNPNVSSVTLTITGDTTYNEGLEYLISANQVVNTVSGKQIPIGTSVTVNNLGTVDDSYFTNRGGNSSIYKIISKNTIKEDGELVVGYITKGATGVNGSVTVSAWLDGDKIAISDTYDGSESDNNGTTNDWVNDRVVLTATEWNSLQTNGVSFKLKVEANEGIWVDKPSAYKMLKENADTVTQINFGNISSDTNGKGLYRLYGTESDNYPIYYYRGEVNNNNVTFGGFCWQIIRTTETGGIKMIYNGIATDNGTTCNNTDYTNRIIDFNAFNANINSPSYVGYMYNAVYEYSISDWIENAVFGSDVTWNGTNYTLIDANVTTPDATHHYSCNATTSSATCTSLRYVYYKYDADGTKYYITITNGEKVEDAIYKMTGNGTDEVKSRNAGYKLNTQSSDVKTFIETWFKTNLTNEIDSSKTNYQEYLEDTEFCNERNFKTVEGNQTYPTFINSGWNPNGGRNPFIWFGARDRLRNGNWFSTTNVPALTCKNITDRFMVGNNEAKLNYPVGLITVDETILAGAAGNSQDNNTDYYLYINDDKRYWSMTPTDFYDINSSIFMIGSIIDTHSTSKLHGIRPVISLKSGTEFLDNTDGTPNNPYLVKYN